MKTTTTTTERPFLTINIPNIPNITSLISTILRPVTTSEFKDQPKCVAKKGNKLQERILITDDEDEDDEGSLSGDTKFAEYPWMLELLKKNKASGSYEYKCGAVLINPTTAITAYHCLKSKVAGNFMIRAGEWDRSSTLEIIAHQDRTLSKIISHPQYYSGGLFNDIAILKWNDPLNLEVNVQPLCLPEENQTIVPGHRCTVTAWGKTSSDNPSSSDILRFVKVPFVEHARCQTQFQNFRLGRRFQLHASFLCFGGEEGLDSCGGDGGSPIVCEQDGSYYLAGIVSWGLDCGKKDVPAAYTNVPHLLKWIKSHI
jgi:plasma kallikrein